MARTVARKALDDIADDAALWQELERIAVAKVEPIFREIYLGGVMAGVIIVRRMGVGTKDVAEEDEADFLEIIADPAFSARSAMIITAYSNEWWQSLAASTRRGLLDAIIDAREQGTSVHDLKKQIEPLFGKARAERIAVTEMTRLFGRGAQATYQAVGVEKWLWRTAEDGRVCPDCDQMAAGGPYDMAETFGPIHTNDRCWPVPFIEPAPTQAVA